MAEYTQEEIKHIKDALKDYKNIRTTFETLIDNGNTINEMLDIVEKYIRCDITNYEIGTYDFDYIDINYRDINVSIIQDKDKGMYISDYIEIWCDKKSEYLGATNYEKWKEIIKEV